MTFDPDKLREQLFGESDAEEKSEESAGASPREPETDDSVSIPDKSTKDIKDSAADDIPAVRDLSDETPLSFGEVPGESELTAPGKNPEDPLMKLMQGKPEHAPENLKDSPVKPVEPEQPKIESNSMHPISERIAQTDGAHEKPIDKTWEKPEPVDRDIRKESEQSTAAKPASTEIKKTRPVILSPTEPSKVKAKKPVMTLDQDPKKKVKPKAMKNKVPDEIEKTNADDFAPLREVIVEGEKTRSETPAGIKSPSPISLLVLIGGAISLIFATISLAMGKTDISVLGLGGIGFVLISTFTIINKSWLKLAMSARSTRYSFNVSIVVLTFLGILIFLNILSYRYHIRFDVSQQNLNSLSSQSIAVLDDIDRAGEDIFVTAFIPPNTDFRAPVEELMNLYTYHSPHIKFSFVDPEIQRALTEEKGITTSMAILFELGTNRSVQNDFDEPHITSGLIGVRQTYTKKVAFVTGHGEVDPFNDNDIGGLSEFKDKLELEGYEVERLSISPSAGIPRETSLLVVVGPEQPFRNTEITAIEEYLEDGGDLMCFIEPGDQSGLHDLFARYGIIVEEGVILDDFENSNGEVKMPQIFVKSMDHPVTRVILDNLIFNVTGSLREASGSYDDVVTEVLLSSGASAWIENSDDLRFTEEVETRGQKYVAILATRRVEKDAAPETESINGEDPLDTAEPAEPAEPAVESVMDKYTPSQLLVVSDSSMIRNGSSDIAYNFDFTLNAVNHMTDAENLIGIRAARDIDRTLDLSSIQTKIIFGVSIILTPLLIAFMGGYVWLRRRS